MTDSLRVVAGVAALVAIWLSGVANAATGFKMVELVNMRLTSDEQFPYGGWWLGKTPRLHREYRRLYPSGPHIRRQRWLGTVMALALGVLMVALGFPTAFAFLFALSGTVMIWLVHRP